MSRRSRLLTGKSDKIMDITCAALIVLASAAFLYPVVYIVSLSFSGNYFVERRQIWLYPMGLNLNAYRLAFKHEFLLRSYWNSVVYSVTGTAYSLLLTLLGAYALSFKNLRGRGLFTMLIFVTMLFSGGLIPTYLLVKDLNMLNKIWAMIIPCAVSQWNLIVMRTIFQQNPESLVESAKIDGANHLHILFRIVAPISTPVIATMGLLYLVGKWNDYFTALVYLNSKDKLPLQLVARELLVTLSDQTLNRATNQNAEAMRLSYSPLSFRAAIIVLTVAPLMVIYPFLQRYFVKGIAIGAVKG